MIRESTDSMRNEVEGTQRRYLIICSEMIITTVTRVFIKD